jgi:hypothetical protein
MMQRGVINGKKSINFSQTQSLDPIFEAMTKTESNINFEI